MKQTVTRQNLVTWWELAFAVNVMLNRGPISRTEPMLIYDYTEKG